MNCVNYDEFLKKVLDEIAVKFKKNRSSVVGFVTSRVSEENWLKVEVGNALQEELYNQGYKNKQVFFEIVVKDEKIRNSENKKRQEADILIVDMTDVKEEELKNDFRKKKKELPSNVEIEVVIELKHRYDIEEYGVRGWLSDVDNKIKEGQRIDYLLFSFFVNNFHLLKGLWKNYNKDYAQKLDNELNNIIKIIENYKWSCCVFKHLYTSNQFDFSFSLLPSNIKETIQGKGVFILFKKSREVK